MLLSLILCHVKEEAEANKMTKEEQIGRLLRPGYTYRLALCLYLFLCLYSYLFLYLYGLFLFVLVSAFVFVFAQESEPV